MAGLALKFGGMAGFDNSFGGMAGFVHIFGGMAGLGTPRHHPHPVWSLLIWHFDIFFILLLWCWLWTLHSYSHSNIALKSTLATKLMNSFLNFMLWPKGHFGLPSEMRRRQVFHSTIWIPQNLYSFCHKARHHKKSHRRLEVERRTHHAAARKVENVDGD